MRSWRENQTSSVFNFTPTTTKMERQEAGRMRGFDAYQTGMISGPSPLKVLAKIYCD